MVKEKLDFGNMITASVLGLTILAVVGYIKGSIELIDTILAIATIWMAGFVAHQAWATYGMTKRMETQIKLTWQTIEEMKKEREFILKREHTKKLKERVVIPLIKELSQIIDASKSSDPRPKVRWIRINGELLEVFGSIPYTGRDSPIETIEEREDVLFDDLIKNHATEELKDNYKLLKLSAQELDHAFQDLKERLSSFLKDRGIKLLTGEELNNPKIEIEGFEKENILAFFLECLIEKRNPLLKIEGVNYSFDSKGSRYITEIVVKHVNNREKSYTLRYSNKRTLTENEINQIKTKLEKLIREALEEFKDGIYEIYGLIIKFNTSKEIVLRELKTLEAKEIYEEDCDYVRGYY